MTMGHWNNSYSIIILSLKFILDANRELETGLDNKEKIFIGKLDKSPIILQSTNSLPRNRISKSWHQKTDFPLVVKKN